MGLTKQDAREVLDIYIRAWEKQDPDLIVTIFTPSATYHERVLEDPIPDREAIQRYWVEKVVRSQANIKCELLNLYLDGSTVIAEWEAEFDDVAQGVRKRMREIAILTFEGRLISSLREYWASEHIGQQAAPATGGRRLIMDETAGRAFRAAWIGGVKAHYPGEPKQGYVASWDEMPEWERQAAAAVCSQVREFIGATNGAAARLTREQKGRFVALCWIGQIYRHFSDPKPAYVADWDEMPEWQRETDADIFEDILSAALAPASEGA